jgi:hypothetical protein
MSIDELLNDFFPEPMFRIRRLKSEYDNVPRYGISTGNEDCAFIQLFDDHIYIELLERCGINGSQTIRKIEQLAVKLENISYISLEDDSTLKVYPEFDIWINLYIYKILTKGQSWYNSLDYYSDNYAEEKEDNAKFEKMTIKEFQDDVSSSDINNKKYNKHLNDLIEIFSFEPDESMTVPDFYNKIMEIIGSDEPDKKRAKWLEDDLNFVLESKIINYNAKKLEKRILVPTGDARGKAKKMKKGKKTRKSRKGRKSRKSRKTKRNKKKSKTNKNKKSNKGKKGKKTRKTKKKRV